MLITLAYLLLVTYLLIGHRKTPNGPYLLSNSYALFLTLPCAIAYYFIHSNVHGIDYGNYNLNKNTYNWIFFFQVIVLLAGFAGYKSGFSSIQAVTAKSRIFIDEGALIYKFSTVFFICCSVFLLMYVHYAFDFAYLLEPRRLYELSREDFGSHYFALGFFIRISALLLLMSNFRRKFTYILLLVIFSLLTGAKINTYIIVMFVAMYFIIFRLFGILSIRRVLYFAIFGIPLAYFLIFLTFQNSDTYLLQLLVAYVNEPWNNFSLLVQSYDQNFASYFYGSLTWENNTVSRMPRPLFPDKPYIFGGFRLAEQYFPETVALGIGAPSFGAEGIVYADWGIFGLLMLVALKWLISWGLGRLTAILTHGQTSNSSGNFLYFGGLLIMADLYFFTLPPSNNLVDNLVVLLALSAVFGIHRTSQTRLGLPPQDQFKQALGSERSY